MCGLVGVAGRIGIKEHRVFDTLLKIDTIRGPHSTGVLFVDRNNHSQIMKTLGTPWELESENDYKKLTALTYNVLLGHNRWATKGAITTQNAHPFDFPTLAGAHNGTLTNQSLLDDHKNFQVDSENIYHHMDRHGVEATCKVLAGAYALTWYDKVEQSINFLRNDQRELHYAYSQDRHTLFWASEKWMIIVATSRNDIAIQDIQTFNEHHHYKMVVPLEPVAGSKPFTEVTVKKLEAYVPPIVAFQPWKGMQQHQHQHQQSSVTSVQLASYLNRELVFDVIRESNANGQWYIEGELISGQPIKVRVNKNPDELLWADLKRKGVFRGVAKSFSWLNGGYLNIDCRTVIRDDVDASDDVGDDDDLLYKVGDKILTEKQAQDFADRGCAWCSCPEDVQNIEDVYVMHDNNYVCTSCIQFEEVKPFLN